MRRKGELSPAEVDRRWPHQVAVEIPAGHGLGIVPATGPLSSLCARGHDVACDGKRCRVFCFSDPDQATHFRGIMGGIEFDPRDVAAVRIGGPGTEDGELRAMPGAVDPAEVMSFDIVGSRESVSSRSSP